MVSDQQIRGGGALPWAGEPTTGVSVAMIARRDRKEGVCK
jgi:hypothetical protein